MTTQVNQPKYVIGFKDDKGKNRLSLVLGTMARAIEEVGKVGTFGAQKYAADNWLKVDDAPRRYTDALFRHLLADLRGEQRDSESGLLHLAHTAWCALAILDLRIREQQGNIDGIPNQATAEL